MQETNRNDIHLVSNVLSVSALYTVWQLHLLFWHRTQHSATASHRSRTLPHPSYTCRSSLFASPHFITRFSHHSGTNDVVVVGTNATCERCAYNSRNNITRAAAETLTTTSMMWSISSSLIWHQAWINVHQRPTMPIAAIVCFWFIFFHGCASFFLFSVVRARAQTCDNFLYQVNIKYANNNQHSSYHRWSSCAYK